MSNKAEFLREALSLDPDSKLYLPLARLLAERGEAAEAAAILARGLERHPGDFEAKLLLIECLERAGDHAAALAAVEPLAELFAAHPTLWHLLSELSAKQSSDAAVAFKFLAAFGRGTVRGWTELLHHGLDHLDHPARQAVHRPQVLSKDETPVGEAADAPRRAAPGEISSGGGGREFGAEDVAQAPPIPVRGRAASGKQGVQEQVARVAARGARLLGSAGEASLRTRTMADLLAAQGDFKEAMDIYQELLATSASDEEREALRLGLNELKARIKGSAGSSLKAEGSGAAREEGEDSARGVGDEAPGTDKSRVVSMLDRLALRLEERASS